MFSFLQTATMAHSPVTAASPEGVNIALPSMLVLADANHLQVARDALVELELGWEVVFAKTTAEADDMLRVRAFDVILIDLGYSHVDGLDATEQFVRQRPHIPVVLMSPPACVSIALEAMSKGAINHFPRELLDSEPSAVLNTLRQIVQLHQTKRISQECTLEQRVEYVLPNERNYIPAMIDELQSRMLQTKWCDRAIARRVNVAIEEALLNAMIHGNLEVSSDLRQEDERVYDRLIQQRKDDPAYRDRRVKFTATFSDQAVRFRIEDDGPGFDVASLPDPVDPANLFRIGGRGILLMRSFMTTVEYAGRGNIVTLIKTRPQATIAE